MKIPWKYLQVVLERYANELKKMCRIILIPYVNRLLDIWSRWSAPIICSLSLKCYKNWLSSSRMIFHWVLQSNKIIRDDRIRMLSLKYSAWKAQVAVNLHLNKLYKTTFQFYGTESRRTESTNPKHKLESLDSECTLIYSSNCKKCRTASYYNNSEKRDQK